MGQSKYIRFENELGNTIRISVAVSDPTTDGIGKVRVLISGPESHSSNLLTMREAQELRRALAWLPEMPERS